MNNTLFKSKDHHPLYKGGGYRDNAFEAYEHKCVVCGYSEDERVLEVHHKDEDRSNNTLSKNQLEVLESELKRTGITMETVKDRYKIVEPEGMNKETYNRVIAALKKTKSAA